MPRASSLRVALQALLPADILLPLHAGSAHDPDVAGLIYADDGRPIATVDPDRLLSDEAAGCIAQAFVLAVNTVCGFDTPSNMAHET